MEYRPGDLKYTREQAEFYRTFFKDQIFYRLAPACSQCAAPEKYLFVDNYNQRLKCEYCGGISSLTDIRNGHIIKI